MFPLAFFASGGGVGQGFWYQYTGIQIYCRGNTGMILTPEQANIFSFPALIPSLKDTFPIEAFIAPAHAQAIQCYVFIIFKRSCFTLRGLSSYILLWQCLFVFAWKLRSKMKSKLPLWICNFAEATVFLSCKHHTAQMWELLHLRINNTSVWKQIICFYNLLFNTVNQMLASINVDGGHLWLRDS